MGRGLLVVALVLGVAGVASAEVCVPVETAGWKQDMKNAIIRAGSTLIYAALPVKVDPCTFCVPIQPVRYTGTVANVCFPDGITIDPAPVITRQSLEAKEAELEAIRDQAKNQEKAIEDAAEDELESNVIEQLTLANVGTHCATRYAAIAGIPETLRTALVAECQDTLRLLVATREAK